MGKNKEDERYLDMDISEFKVMNGSIGVKVLRKDLFKLDNQNGSAIDIGKVKMLPEHNPKNYELGQIVLFVRLNGDDYSVYEASSSEIDIKFIPEEYVIARDRAISKNIVASMIGSRYRFTCSDPDAIKAEYSRPSCSCNIGDKQCKC